MKNTIQTTITFTLIAFFFSCQTGTQEEDIQKEALHGFWQSEEDAKYQLNIEETYFINVYDGKLLATSTYEFFEKGEACEPVLDKPCITIKGLEEGESITYSIMEANETTLAMYGVKTAGQPLIFKKTEPFGILPNEPQTQQAETLCYQGAANSSDQFSLELTFEDNDVTGYLTYFFPNAHSVIGRLEGTLDGKILFADYTHIIEGSKQVSEVSFKYDDGYVFEGKGELMESGDKLVFKDRSQIKYEIRYTMTDCAGIAAHLQWSKEAF